MGPRAGLDGRKISSPPEFDPGRSSPYSVAIPTELPSTQFIDIMINFKEGHDLNHGNVSVVRPVICER